MTAPEPFRVVERPTRLRQTPLLAALRATATSGKAVQIPLNGRAPKTVQGSLRAVFAYDREYRFHCHSDTKGRTLVGWTSRRKTPGASPRGPRREKPHA